MFAVAIGLTLALSGQAQNTDPSFEQKPMAETGQSDTANESDDATKPDIKNSLEVLTAIKGIETAIRDLIAEEDKIEADHQRKNEKRDLDAQEAMAKWARWMFWATFGSAGVTLVGLILIGFTLSYTRKAAEYTDGLLDQARKATVATIGAVEAAESANVVSTKNAFIDQRPWVSVEVIEFQHVDVDTVQNIQRLGFRHFSAIVSIRVINTGKTPAQSVEVWVAAVNDEGMAKALEAVILPNNDHNGHSLIGVIPPNSALKLDFPISRPFDDIPNKSDFEFQSRLFCSIRYSTEASRRGDHDAQTLQTFIIESDGGGGRRSWINTVDIRQSRVKIEARPAFGQMT